MGSLCDKSHTPLINTEEKALLDCKITNLRKNIFNELKLYNELRKRSLKYNQSQENNNKKNKDIKLENKNEDNTNDNKINVNENDDTIKEKNFIEIEKKIKNLEDNQKRNQELLLDNFNKFKNEIFEKIRSIKNNQSFSFE